MVRASSGSQNFYIRARMGRKQDGHKIAEGLGRFDRELASMVASAGPLIADLISTEQLRSGCVEERDQSDDWSLSAVGASVFVPDAVADAYIHTPKPYMSADIFKRYLSGETGIILTGPEIAEANAGSGLNLVILGFTHKYDDTSPKLQPLLARAIDHFVHAHRGYNLRLLLREDPEPIASLLVQAGMRKVKTFDEVDPADPGIVHQRSLIVRDRSDPPPAFPISVATALFAFSPPVIGFNATERRVLSLACDGALDSEVSEELQMSANSVKLCWRGIYERTLRKAPLALGSSGQDAATGGVRGQEKRRFLLAYLREHPQELRPYLHG